MDEQSPQAPLGGPSFVPWALMVEGLLIAVAVGLSWLLGQPPLGRFAFSFAAVGWGVVATGPMLLLLLLLRAPPWQPFVRLREVVDQTVLPLFDGWSTWDLASLALVAGVGEEMLFRGVLQDAIARGTGPWLAVLVASIIFGAMHSITRAYAVVATVLGLWLGAVYLWSGNLLAAMIAHALYDFITLVVLLHWGDRSGGFGEDRGEAKHPSEQASEDD